MMTFDAAAFGPITLDHLPPFAQRLREAANLVWEEGYRQPFLRELGNGTLDRERFAFYLLQDYRYLNDYAKVHALALTKTQDPEVMRFMADVQNGIFNVESAMHRKYMASYGISEQEMNSVRQSAFARAYTSNILSIAYGNPLVDVLVAVLPAHGCTPTTGSVSLPNSRTRLIPTRTRAGWTCTKPRSSGAAPHG